MSTRTLASSTVFEHYISACNKRFKYAYHSFVHIPIHYHNYRSITSIIILVALVQLILLIAIAIYCIIYKLPIAHFSGIIVVLVQLRHLPWKTVGGTEDKFGSRMPRKPPTKCSEPVTRTWVLYSQVIGRKYLRVSYFKKFLVPVLRNFWFTRLPIRW